MEGKITETTNDLRSTQLRVMQIDKIAVKNNSYHWKCHEDLWKYRWNDVD